MSSLCIQGGSPNWIRQSASGDVSECADDTAVMDGSWKMWVFGGMNAAGSRLSRRYRIAGMVLGLVILCTVTRYVGFCLALGHPGG